MPYRLRRTGWTALLLAALAPAAMAAEVDTTPTGALRPAPLASPRAASRLDLSPPPGLAVGLPPEAASPAILPAAAPAQDIAVPQAEPGPQASPAAAAPAPQASPADALAREIHAALDLFVAGKPDRRAVGAGDWAAARVAISALYAERAYAPLWVEGDHWGPKARAALARLARAGDDGLELAATPTPPVTWSDAAPERQAQADVALSAAVVAYAMQASGARLHPAAFSKDVSAKPEVADPGAALKAVAAADDPDAALAAFNPPQEGYRALRTALAALRAETQKPEAPEKPEARMTPGPVLKLGMSDPRVPLIRARFGLGPRDEGAASDVYDVRVASAVAAFQRVHGLPVNGALTEATAHALDGAGHASAGKRREATLLANMEMWRWLPRDMGETRVEVNVPDFSLTLTEGGAVAMRTRVIVGKPDTPTPIFSNSIKYMLFNPIWRVPQSIIKKEMEPKLASDPGYFERHGYKVTYVGDRIEVQQPPGERNALGRMLFLFPNAHAVYLHDTPQRGLFASSYRAFSHGCVRVEDPQRLAEALMGGAERGWTPARVRSLIGDKERTFALPVPVPVHLEYFTAFVDENGTLRERPDLYGLTSKVASALAKLTQD